MLISGSIMWGESVEQERQQFGVDHCLVGKCIGLSWNFPPEIIDVLEHHHRPQEARQDGILVETVGAADLVCKMHGVRVGGEPSRITLADQNAYKNLLDSCAPSLTNEEKTALAKILEVEFPDIIRSLELRVAAIWG
jgi:HD-like signal output (HDOD) protein